MQETTANRRFLEVRYTTATGKQATPRYAPSEAEEQLERKLKALYRQHTPATVINLLTGEEVGGVKPGSDTTPWEWWYWPAGMSAQPEPTQVKKIVCRHSYKNAKTHVSAN